MTREHDHQSGARPWHQIAALVTLVCCVPIALFYGRRLERAYPSVVRAIPYLILLFVLGHSTRLALLASRELRKHERALSSRAACLIALAVTLPLIFVTAASFMTRYPVEYVHIAKYGALTYAITRIQRDHSTVAKIIRAFLVSAALGICEETAQRFVPGRFFDVWDILLNISGCFFGGVYTAVHGALEEEVRAADSETGAEIGDRPLRTHAS